MKLQATYLVNAEPGRCGNKGKGEHVIPLGEPVLEIFLFDRVALGPLPDDGAKIGDGKYPTLRLCCACSAPALEAMQIWFADKSALEREASRKKTVGLWISDPSDGDPLPPRRRQKWLDGPAGNMLAGTGITIKMACCDAGFTFTKATLPLIDMRCQCAAPNSWVVKWGPFAGDP